MGRLGHRLERREGDERERAIRQVHATVSAIPDARLEELFTFENGAVPSVEDLGLSEVLVKTASDWRDDLPRDELERRVNKLMRPLWSRLDLIRQRRRNR